MCSQISFEASVANVEAGMGTITGWWCWVGVVRGHSIDLDHIGGLGSTAK